MNNEEIPPRHEWKNLSSFQLYDVKSKMMSIYFNMRSMNASFSEQYRKFISEIDELIAKTEASERGGS